jgi:hypothetical protein
VPWNRSLLPSIDELSAASPGPGDSSRGPFAQWQNEERAMRSVGNVRIGSKSIDIQAFTGEVMDTAHTTYVETVRNQNGVSSTSTSHWNKFLLANGSGQHSIEVSERVIHVSSGQTVTGFWGVVRGKDSDWLALFNHDTGKWGWFMPTRNTLAGPPMNQLLIIVAVFAGVFSVMSLFGAFGSPGPATFIWLAIAALIFWRIQRRRKALMNAVTTALSTVRMEA